MRRINLRIWASIFGLPDLLAEGEVLGGQLGLAAKKRSKKNEYHLCPTHAPLPNHLP